MSTLLAPMILRLALAAPVAATSPVAPHGPGEAVTMQTPLRAGSHVHIEWHGTFYEGEVVTLQNDGHVRIHYDGYPSSEDETVPRGRLRIGPGAATVTAPPVPAEPSGVPVVVGTPLVLGQPVLVHRQDSWAEAEVTSVLPDGLVIVHFAGSGHDGDQIVSRDRLRVAVPPGFGGIFTHAPVDDNTPLRAGTAVDIEWSGRWFEGRVVAPLADRSVRVHYTGYGNESDETTPRSRLRLRMVR